jgi:hypothetical protein
MHLLSWHDPEYHKYNQDRIRETFQALYKYLNDLYEKDKGQLRDEETQRGIQAMMLLAGEAAQKIDNFTDIFKQEGESVTALKESSNGSKRASNRKKSGKKSGELASGRRRSACKRGGSKIWSRSARIKNMNCFFYAMNRATLFSTDPFCTISN